VAKKKKKKKIAKRQARAAERKARKRKLRLVKARKQQSGHFQDEYRSSPPVFGPAPFADDIDIPPGFRVVGMSEAMMEFAKAMIRHPDIKGLDGMKHAFNLAMPLWNYALARERDEADDRLRSEIIKALMAACRIGRDEAGELVDQLADLRNEMFPPEIQPEGTSCMFMRKEVSHLITPFNYERLSLNDTVVPPGEQDRRFFDQLAALDELRMSDEDDYEVLEKQIGIVESDFDEVFNIWLLAKGVDDELANVLTFDAQFFFVFIYEYGAADILRHADQECFEEFLYDFVLRKVVFDSPAEHVQWVPALRLLFLFLDEKGYIDEAAPFIRILDAMEEPFLNHLRAEYG